MLIHRLVAERFGGELRIGIGINTGVVIAGTIGGGGKLEFTLIGDTVNVAARVEQLTKTTGDAILLTQQCVDALASRPPGLIDRGFHVLKGKSAAVQVFGLDQETRARVAPRASLCRDHPCDTPYFRCGFRETHNVGSETAPLDTIGSHSPRPVSQPSILSATACHPG